MPSTQTADKSDDLSELSILVVDDNVYMQRIVKAILRAFGVDELEFCSNGAKALKMLSDIEFDLVICDIAMKPIDGIEFLNQLRGDTEHPAQRIPVIMLSGHSDISTVMRAKESGATDFVTKPIAPAMLYTRITHMLEQQRDTFQI